MLQLNNTTPFAVAITGIPDPRGIDTLYVTAKATFSFSENGVAVAESQLPLRMADEYVGDPGTSSLRYASEVHPCKPSTDIVVVGSAHAPSQREVQWLDVQVQVSSLKKTIRVFGDRKWRGRGNDLSISPPVPFLRMPIVYERAYGGLYQDGSRTKVLFDERNPVGVGFAGERKPAEMAGLPLPNLEDPAQLIGQCGDRPCPAGFGYVAPSWEPRKCLAGTYDAEWQRTRAPYLPTDFQPGFFNAAHPDLVAPRYLAGGEPLSLLNLTASGAAKFTLPVCRFETTVHVAGREEGPQMNLETVLIEPDEGRLSLIWRASVACDKTMLKVSRVDIGVKEMVLNGVRA